MLNEMTCTVPELFTMLVEQSISSHLSPRLLHGRNRALQEHLVPTLLQPSVY